MSHISPPLIEPLTIEYWKKVGLSLLATFFLLLIWVAANSIDRGEFDDQGLLDIFSEDLSDRTNALPLILELIQTNTEHAQQNDSNRIKEHIFGLKWDNNFVTETLEREKALIQLGSNLDLSHYVKYPEEYDAFMAMDFMPLIFFTRILLLKSIYLAKQGDISEAIRYLSSAKNSALLIREHKNYTLLGYRIAEVGLRSSLYWAHQLASDYPLKSPHFAELKTVIDSIPSYESDGFKNLFSGEYNFIQLIMNADLEKSREQRYKALQEIISSLGEDLESFGISTGFQAYLQVIWPRYYLHPNRYLHNAAPHYLASKDQSKDFCDNQAFTSHDEEYPIPKFYESGLLISSQQHSFFSYFHERCLLANYVESMKAIISFYWYKREHGEFPTALSALIPEFSDALPINYFNGKPLLYSDKDQWFYSAAKSNSESKGTQESLYAGRCNKNASCWNNPTISIKYDADLAR